MAARIGAACAPRKPEPRKWPESAKSLRDLYAARPLSLSKLHGATRHIHGMSNLPPFPDERRTRLGRRLFRRWMWVADWLGGCKPLELILGAVLLITGLAWLIRLV